MNKRKPTAKIEGTEVEIGDVLRRLRERGGFGLRELARALSMDAGQLSRVESGKEHPSTAVLSGYAEQFGINSDSLHRIAGRVPGDLLAFVKGQPSAVRRLMSGIEQVERNESDGVADVSILEEVLEEEIREEERSAFTDMLDRLTSGRQAVLTSKQRDWVKRTRKRFGLDDSEVANVFSEASPEEQARMRAEAAKVVLPWEKAGAAKALKPPGR